MLSHADHDCDIPHTKTRWKELFTTDQWPAPASSLSSLISFSHLLCSNSHILIITSSKESAPYEGRKVYHSRGLESFYLLPFISFSYVSSLWVFSFLHREIRYLQQIPLLSLGRTKGWELTSFGFLRTMKWNWNWVLQKDGCNFENFCWVPKK